MHFQHISQAYTTKFMTLFFPFICTNKRLVVHICIQAVINCGMNCVGMKYMVIIKFRKKTQKTVMTAQVQISIKSSIK